MKRQLLVCVAVGALAAVAASGATVYPSFTEDGTNWYLWCSVSPDCAGLAGFDVDVLGQPGTAVTSSRNCARIYYDPELEAQVGFSGHRNNGTNGIEICGAQATIYSGPNDPAADSLVIQSVGQVPGSHGSTTWGSPLLLAEGTYTGDGRFEARYFMGNVLKNVDGGSWQGPGNVAAAAGPITVSISKSDMSVSPGKNWTFTGSQTLSDQPG